MLESLDPEDQLLLSMTKPMVRIPTPSPPGHPGRSRYLGLWESRSLCRQSGDSVSAGDRSFGPDSYWDGWRSVQVFLTPATEPKLTNPHEVQEAIMGLKVSKAHGPNSSPNRALKHLPQRAFSLLVLIFNAILFTHIFPTVWKHARVISILKLGKDPALPSFYRHINLFDTIDKLLEYGIG